MTFRPFRRDEDLSAAKAFAKSRGERATATAVASDGTRLVTTTHALYVGDDLRLPWDRVVRATWEVEEGILSVLGSEGPGQGARSLRIAMPESPRLLDTLRTEVTSNIVAAQRIEDRELGGAWVTARRVAGSDEIRWTVMFDAGRDPDDPRRRSWADAQLETIRAATGV